MERLFLGWVLAIYAPRTPPPARAPAPPPARIEVPPSAPTATELAQLYVKTARELTALERTRGIDAAIDLWPRFRWIRINDALVSLPKRVETVQILEQLRRDVAATQN